MINQGYFKKLAQVESSNNPLAQNTKSSAKGLFQFIDATAKDYGITAEFGTPEYTKQETDAVKKLTSDNFNYLKKTLGRDPTNGELYLAHQQGASGAEKILTQPDQKAVDVLGRDEVLNNGGNEDMTLSEFANKWTSKFDSLDAKEKGISQEENNTEGDVVVDAFSDFGISVDGQGIDAFADFQILPDNEFFTDNAGKNEILDTESGAPSYIRSIVGSVYDAESRLQTIRQYYPDAQPYEDNNFIYTNPENGRKTVFNPSGLDRGDVAGVLREGMIAIGSGLGATAGFVGGIPTTAGIGSVPMAAVGAGIGAATTASAYDALMEQFGFTKDTRGIPSRLAGTAAEGLMGATGEVIGRSIAPLAKSALGGAKATQQRMLSLFKELEITPSLSAVTGTKGAAQLESSLASSPFGSSAIEAQTEKIIAETHKAANKIVLEYGVPKTTAGAGETIKQAVIDAGERIGFRQERLYQEAYDAMGQNVLVDIKAVKALRKKIGGEVSKAPESLYPKLKEALKEMDAIIADAGNNGIDFEALRQIRTNIGQDLDNEFIKSGSENAAMKRVYGALSEDLGSVASQVNEEAAKKIKAADRYTRIYETQYRETMLKIMKFDAEEKAYRFATRGLADGAGNLKKLKSLFKPDEWGVVASSTLNKLGKATAGAQDETGELFSVNTFLTNWNKLSDEAKDVLFNTPQHRDTYQALNRLVEVSSKIKDVLRTRNVSNTASAMQGQLFLQALGGGFAGLTATGEGTGGFAGAAVGAVLAPRYASKLITSPRFIEWLATPVEQGINSIPAHISRLIAIGNTDETLKDPIREYIKNLDRITKDE